MNFHEVVLKSMEPFHFKKESLYRKKKVSLDHQSVLYTMKNGLRTVH